MQTISIFVLSCKAHLHIIMISSISFATSNKNGAIFQSKKNRITILESREKRLIKCLRLIQKSPVSASHFNLSLSIFRKGFAMQKIQKTPCQKAHNKKLQNFFWSFSFYYLCSSEILMISCINLDSVTHFHKKRNLYY